MNESELYIELPSRCRGSPGARLYIIGADHPDALRGIYLDGVILDEYADIKPELWGGVIRPALSDRAGWAVFIGTPKGQNQFYEMYQHAQKSAGWYACIYRADESGVLPTEELADMKAQMTAMEIRQELLCDFTASASDVVIPIDLVTEAGDLVIDFFGGSGSTLVAAEMTGRVCYTTELDPKYVDTIIRRYIETSGKQTVTVERGGRELTLAEVMGKDTGGDVDA